MSSESIPVPTDFNKVLYTSLAEQDPEVAELIEKETWRQFSGLESVRLAPSALTASPLAGGRLSTSCPGAEAEPKPTCPTHVLTRPRRKTLLSSLQAHRLREPDVARRHGGERLDPHQQVL
jgi:hypothetical protein